MVMQSEYVRISFPAALVPELAEQAPAHEIAPAALQQKQHQLQLKCEGAGQAAHRIAEAASRTGKAGTCTFAPGKAGNGSSRINTRRNSRCCSRPKARTKPKAGTCTKCSLIKCARARQPAHRIAEICHWFFASQTALCFHLAISFWRHGLAWLGSHGG